VTGRNQSSTKSTLGGFMAQTEAEPEPLLQVRALQVHFPIKAGLFKRTVGRVRAVDGVDVDIHNGRTLALVGESGCGKTTVGKSILQLIRPTGGSVRFGSAELTSLSHRDLRLRRSDFQIIFQDPYSSMNPRMLVEDIIAEGMKVQRADDSRDQRRARVERQLQQVGLSADSAARYPHEFSGGQRQRISIARALAVEPKLIICDEPTSALDVSVQAQILNLLQELQTQYGISYLFITHNMSVVSYIADEIAVMYLGRIVERGRVGDVLRDPQHPYTQALLSAVPVLDPQTKREVIRLEGDIPSPSNPPTGCYFHPRCPRSMDVCRQRYPRRSPVKERHYVDCHLYTTDEPSPSGFKG
jgi:peptide/nickel transport system ATP-binding protein